MRTQGAGRTAEFAQACDLKLAIDEQGQVPRHHGPEPQAAGDIVVRRIELDEIVIVHELTTGLATSIKTRIAARPLTLQGQEPKSLDGVGRWHPLLSSEPALQDGLAAIEQFGR